MEALKRDKNMDCLADMMKRLSIHNYEIGSEHSVDITHINTPYSFFARPTIYRKYRIYLRVLHLYKYEIRPEELHVGTIVVYKSTIQQRFIRGRIMFIVNENEQTVYDIFALDYGYFEKDITINRVRKVFPKMDVPALAVHCQLANCKPNGGLWKDNIADCMRFLIGKERTKMIIKEKLPHVIEVELINSSTGSIATMLAYSGCTFQAHNVLVHMLSNPEPEKTFYDYMFYNPGEILIVRIQTTISLLDFYVSRIEDYERYLIEKNELTNLCQNEDNIKPEDLKVGMPVAIFIDTRNKYERGLVNSIDEKCKLACVQLIDWGSTINATCSSLKVMPSKFFSTPAAALHCSLKPKYANDARIYKDMVTGNAFKIKILSGGNPIDDKHIVMLKPILISDYLYN